AGDIENLVILGTLATNGTGNGLDNAITGNAAANILVGDAGNDTLDGGAGNDNLDGGLGNDVFVVGTGDVLSDSGGTDTVQSAVNFTLQAGFENLTLLGTAATGTGNSSDNVLTGN